MEIDFVTVVVLVVLFCLALWALIAIGGPPYRVWAQRLQGEADLAQAAAETKITIRRSEAEREAAIHYAEADVERAKGIARAIGEIEQKLGGAEGYLRWKYIHMLEESEVSNQIIYVPTEAGLPVLEAGKRP